jgi:hypothetical protein
MPKKAPPPLGPIAISSPIIRSPDTAYFPSSPRTPDPVSAEHNAYRSVSEGQTPKSILKGGRGGRAGRGGRDYVDGLGLGMRGFDVSDLSLPSRHVMGAVKRARVSTVQQAPLGGGGGFAKNRSHRSTHMSRPALLFHRPHPFNAERCTRTDSY